MRILVFGDSIANGAWDTEGGWVDRLRREAHEELNKTRGGKKVQIYNLGIGGDTTDKLLKRIEPEATARIGAGWTNGIVIAVGTNDSRTIDGKPEVSGETFTSNVRSLHEIAKQHANKVLFLGIPPAANSKIEFKNYVYSNNRIIKFNNLLAETTEELGAEWLPLYEVFHDRKGESLFIHDLLHPNNNGHQLIAEQVKPYIDKWAGDSNA